MTGHTDEQGALVSASANVRTDAAARYAKQLASHLGRKATVEDLPDGHRIRLTVGYGDVLVREDHLLLIAVAPDLDGLATVQRVVGGHLERFGQRAELVVEWSAPESR
ncbi:DUF2218 domain-containing protein [Georgenia thermotolerans]|uniref:DUF2218 domain-containing protein n=1 Tax=Georgenia thermotolerans TaxID=527326 RepID=A0A7J5UMA4_9MICO|nr:DUF2218 domain-containing protein [Georgenia thermotolerans]KAE8763063.1 DUF2218 domain-containing protein [Georgenia thermotolerans]